MSTQGVFKNTSSTIVSDPFLESINRTVKAMRQIAAVDFCNPVLSFIRKSEKAGGNRTEEIPVARFGCVAIKCEKKEVPQIAVGLIRKVQTCGE